MPHSRVHVHVTNIDKANDLYMSKPFNTKWKDSIKLSFSYGDLKPAYLILDVRKSNPGTEQTIKWYSNASTKYNNNDAALLRAVFTKPHQEAVASGDLSEGVRLIAVGGQHTSTAARETYEENPSACAEHIAFRDSYIYVLKDDAGPSTDQVLLLGQQDNLSQKKRQFTMTIVDTFELFINKRRSFPNEKLDVQTTKK
jgi:hypothetical protein